MSTTDHTAITPIALQPGEGEALWFLGNLATVKASAETTGGGLAIVHHHAPRGSGSPLHVHRNEDEWFFVIDGEVTFWIDGTVVVAPAGSFVYGPRGVPHTFTVTSSEAHFLLGAQPAGFESFMRTLSEPATERTLPPASVQPPAPEHMMAMAAEYGIEILGPPGIPT